jgi:hypothetical protein
LGQPIINNITNTFARGNEKEAILENKTQQVIGKMLCDNSSMHVFVLWSKDILILNITPLSSQGQ